MSACICSTWPAPEIGKLQNAACVASIAGVASEMHVAGESYQYIEVHFILDLYQNVTVATFAKTSLLVF
jgi:hypothetical protein